MEWAALAAALVGFVLWLLKRYLVAQDTAQPQRVQEETDANLINPDPVPLSLQLQRMLSVARRKRGGPARLPPTDPGDQVPPGDDVRP